MAGRKLAIIGVGNMGSAILEGVRKAGLFASNDIVVCDLVPAKAQDAAQRHGAIFARTAPEAAAEAEAILIAVKPQTMDECLSGLKGTVKPHQLIISIVAGKTTDFIAGRLHPEARVVRVMPNTPALVGAGVSALCAGALATQEDMAQVERIFAALGKAYRVPESLMDAVTAISGSGPAYLFFFAEHLTKAAISCGLPESQAPDIVAQTLFGSSKLLIESGETPSALRAKVTSPGGTTEAAIATLAQRSFGETIVAGVNSALARAKELGGVRDR